MQHCFRLVVGRVGGGDARDAGRVFVVHRLDRETSGLVVFARTAAAKEALDKYNAQLAEARQEAARIREEAREQGAQIVVELRAKAQEEAERITAHARTQIEAERSQADEIVSDGIDEMHTAENR